MDAILAEEGPIPAPPSPPPAEPERRRRPSFLDEDDVTQAAPVERRRPDSLLAEIERAAGPKGERRRIDDLRAEVQRTLVSDGERSGRGSAKSGRRAGGFLRPSRILLLVVALVAGGLAAYLAVRPEAPVVEPTQEAIIVAAPAIASTRVLVAKAAIDRGQLLSDDLVDWQDWPAASVRPEYITFAARPDALADMAGSVVRTEFSAGEPIREQNLVRADHGYLSAALVSGMRGVSLAVSADAASGGFVLPNDRVDVVLTRTTETGQHADTIVHNVRVLAINARLGETGPAGAPVDPNSPIAERFDQALATLELDTAQTEIVVAATSMGKLTLVMRSLADSTETGNSQELSANQAIRLSSKFWTN